MTKLPPQLPRNWRDLTKRSCRMMQQRTLAGPRTRNPRSWALWIGRTKPRLFGLCTNPSSRKKPQMMEAGEQFAPGGHPPGWKTTCGIRHRKLSPEPGRIRLCLTCAFVPFSRLALPKYSVFVEISPNARFLVATLFRISSLPLLLTFQSSLHPVLPNLLLVV